MAKISTNNMILRRVLRVKAKVKIDTQKLREAMMKSLRELFSLAKRQCENEKLTLPQRQKWVRVAAYVASIINCLTKTFDEAAITKDLAKLEKMINETMAKEKTRGLATPN